MSSGLATFYRPDGAIVGYGVYFGTADILLPFAADTPGGAWEARESGAYPDDCTCGQPPDPIVILSEYGGEWWWLGEWCPRCRYIIGPSDPFSCQVCHENPYYRDSHTCVRPETHDGFPVFGQPSGAES